MTPGAEEVEKEVDWKRPSVSYQCFVFVLAMMIEMDAVFKADSICCRISKSEDYGMLVYCRHYQKK